jgi:spore coat protein A
MLTHRRFAAILCTSASLILSGSLRADTVTLNPIKDNTLYEPIEQDSYEDRSDGAGATMFSGKTKDARTASGGVAVRRAVLEFDIAAAIPAGATIDSVQLTLYCDKASVNTSFNVNLHRSLSEWGEGTSNTGNSQQGRGEPPTPGDTTWHHTFYPDQFWTAQGGDFSSTASATRTVGAIGSYTWGSTSGMVNDVQLWLGTPSANHGWVIIGTETEIQTSKRFATRENTTTTNRPKLVVSYTPQSVSGACCDGSTCTITTPTTCPSPKVYKGDGTSCSPNPCVQAIGACCASNGTCTEVTQSSCQTGLGTYQGDGSTCATVECPLVLAKYVDPLPIPAVATPVSGTSGGVATYDLTVKELQQRLHRDLPLTTVWGFDDGFHGPSYPGPGIEARTNQQVTVEWRNDLRDIQTGALRTSHYLAVDTACIMGAENNAKTVPHLHGGHVPASVDGYPESTFLPGDPASIYVYPNNQQAGYLWYHDHALGVTRLNVYMGLAGLYLLRDGTEDAINLPRAEYEVPLVVQDRKFNPDGTLNYPATWDDHWFGDKVLVNGKVWPYLDVKRGKYRFRILNGSTSRVYTLSLQPPSGALTFVVIGTEGGLLEAPARGVSQITVGPGERYDVVVDFAGYRSGDEIFLKNSAGAPFPSGVVDVVDVMKFKVTSPPGDTDPVPDALRAISRLDPAQSVRTRDFVLKRSGDDGCGRQSWQINELGWNDITEYPELGTTEIWRFINDSGVSHPMHMHLVMFQILDRDGFTKGPNGEIVPDGTPQAPAAEEYGWKDTAMVGPNEILRVIARFEDYKGTYAYHCHILEHEDHDMMRQFQTVLCGDGAVDASEECDDGNLAALDGCNASCDVEEFLELVGTAQGGRIDVTVDGVLISVNVSPGETLAQVLQALADAINANPTLQAAGVTASVQGKRLVTNGNLTTVTITDPGLRNALTLTARRTRLWWSTIGGAGSYDVVRGDLGTLRATSGNFTAATSVCLANDRIETFLDEPTLPTTPGSGLWYLVRGQPAGTYDEGEPSQSGLRDAEIAASGHGCP